MRPRSLHLQGFTVFRTMDASVSFVDADLFALTGPTGSGKTSLLDAMCFALYGRVPRLDARAVEPVIALGAQEARILFEFSVGNDVYTSARVVRRTKTGATTPEARLEIHLDDGEHVVLASGADEVSETVVGLLGLTFDHFTKTVLLPQGAFASFLHDTPAKRQDLLQTLLDLGVYEQMRELAQHRKSRADGEAAVLSRDLERLAAVTVEVEQAANTRVDGLRRSIELVSEVQPEIDKLTASVHEAQQRMQATTALMTDLARLSIPAEVPAIAGQVADATSALTMAETDLEAASARVLAEEELAGTLPDIADLTRLAERWKRHATLVDRRAQGLATTETAKARAVDMASALEMARAAQERARIGLGDIETRHAAQAIAGHLEVGSDCPVCLRLVERLPEHPEVPALDAARSELEQSRRDLERAATDERSARLHLEACGATLTAVDAELSYLDSELEGRPSAGEVESMLEQVRARSLELGALRDAERKAREVVVEARSRLKRTKELEAAGRRELSSVRDRLSPANPPVLPLEDLAADWGVLLSWSQAKHDELTADFEAVAADVAQLQIELNDAMSAVELELQRHQLDPAKGRPGDLLVAALAAAESTLGRIRADREAAVRAAEDLASVTRQADVARSLSRHLQARGFEGWLMEEALHGLVLGANLLLNQLSSGAYSLEMAKRDFVVVDHRNADETRGVKTLSGGETFLVSLALALSLAEQIGAMAAGGTARLESIFLDEGFGTLDVDTLDVVATVIQELGASGRTVGIVTHVTELAELVPTRFEVVRSASGSNVRRIDT